ncbi:MAG: hypothetical protein CO162_01960, partial [bacterium (Candidatus Ratteibacteria) CG_4_9_14_3_um_filter_41_21]
KAVGRENAADKLDLSPILKEMFSKFYLILMSGIHSYRYLPIFYDVSNYGKDRYFAEVELCKYLTSYVCLCIIYLS